MAGVAAQQATFNQLPASIVLPEDMMTLTLDSNTAGALHVVGTWAMHW